MHLDNWPPVRTDVIHLEIEIMPWWDAGVLLLLLLAMTTMMKMMIRKKVVAVLAVVDFSY